MSFLSDYCMLYWHRSPSPIPMNWACGMVFLLLMAGDLRHQACVWLCTNREENTTWGWCSLHNHGIRIFQSSPCRILSALDICPDGIELLGFSVRAMELFRHAEPSSGPVLFTQASKIDSVKHSYPNRKGLSHGVATPAPSLLTVPGNTSTIPRCLVGILPGNHQQ